MDDDEKDKFLDEVRIFNGRPMYLGRKGEPLTLRQWADYNSNLEYRRVGYDEVPKTHRYPASYVSTVWLGLDHNFWPEGPPVIFETMRFVLEATKDNMFFPDRKFHESIEFPDPDPPHEYTEQARYCTEEQASIGHKTIMRIIQETEMI